MKNQDQKRKGGRLAILQYNIAIQNDRGTILYSFKSLSKRCIPT
jgi:hypothetical protein